MRQYFMELSKYGIMLCMVLYTITSTVSLFLRSKGKVAAYIVQCVFLFLTQLICFLSLALAGKDDKYFLLYAFVQVFLLVALIFIPLIYEKINLPLLNIMCMLIGTGLCIIARLSFEKAIKQYVIMLISLILALTIPVILSKYRIIPGLTWVYAFVGIAALGIVLILGEATHGSKISFTLFGGVTFQPSEFVKILFVLFLAGALYEKHNFTRVVLTAIVAGAYVAILVLSKDLGSALIFFVGYVFIVFAATSNYFYLFAGFLGGGIAAYAANLLFRHVHIRVLAWRDPWAYIDKEGWAITQSLFAMGSGSWFGMGIMKGNPKSIPYVDQDFIFSCICEELGIVFGACLVILTLLCFLIMCRIALNNKNNFYRLVAFGLAIMYLFQIFLTVGGGMNLIPLTGVTLPFISYGGSSCMTSMLLFFIVQSVYINNHQEKAEISQNENKRKLLNHQYYVSATLFSVLFVFMTGYLIRFVTVNEQDLVNNSYNSRQDILLSQNYRGTIFSRDGEILAHTVTDATGKETRVYPFENLFSHIVGYSTNGRMGVEAIANYYLINTNISINNKVANDVAGVKNPGDNVYTSLDVQIQQIADSELNIYKGAVIVTEVSTGRILALVSHPDFDPNEIIEIWDDLLADESDSCLLNRATQGLYPPGSTFKILTSLEYMREYSDNIDKYGFQCNGYYKKGENRINCYHGSVHNYVNFVDSFAKSCNSSYANIGMTLDKQQFADTLEDLLFGKELPLTLQYNKSSMSIDEYMSDYDMMQTAIGQGKTLITPMHLNMITCAIANDGVLMKPYLIDKVMSNDGKTVKTFKPQQYGRLMTVEESAELKELMTAVVEKGTATKLKGRNYTAAGKTGSAEYGNIKGESHAWFTGFAPADNPEICVTIIVEGAGSGGDYAVPMARRIFDRYFLEK